MKQKEGKNRSDGLLLREQQRVHVLPALELGLVDLRAGALVVGSQARLLLCELRVEVREVAGVAHRRLVGRLDLSRLQRLPLDRAEELVRADVCDAGRRVAAQPVPRSLIEHNSLK